LSSLPQIVPARENRRYFVMNRSCLYTGGSDPLRASLPGTPCNGREIPSQAHCRLTAGGSSRSPVKIIRVPEEQAENKIFISFLYRCPTDCLVVPGLLLITGCGFGCCFPFGAVLYYCLDN
jgi:hypothetical protein